MTTDLDRRPAILNAIRGIIINLQELEKALTKPSEQAAEQAPLERAPVVPIQPTETPVTVAPEPTLPAASVAVAPISFDELMAQLQDIAVKLAPATRDQTLTAMLQQFGVNKVSELQQSQYADVLIAANALLQEQANS